MSAFRDLEHTGWNAAAGDYDGAFARLTSQSVPSMLDAVKAGPGVRLLDIACGPGYVTAEAAKRGAKVLGLDFSASMLALARKFHPGLEFVEGDAESLKLADASFDAVSMNFGVLHLDHPDKALAEVSRVLAPGGRFGFTVWAPPEQTAAFRIVLGAVARCGNPTVPLPPGPPFFQYADPQVSKAALEAVGLTDVQVKTIPQTWHFAHANDLFDCMLAGTVRTAALLKAQTPEALKAIGEAISAEMVAFKTDKGYGLPMPSVLTSGRKPG